MHGHCIRVGLDISLFFDLLVEPLNFFINLLYQFIFAGDGSLELLNLISKLHLLLTPDLLHFSVNILLLSQFLQGIFELLLDILHHKGILLRSPLVLNILLHHRFDFLFEALFTLLDILDGGFELSYLG